MSGFDEPDDDPASLLIGVAPLDAQHRELHRLIADLAEFPQDSILSLRTRRLIREVWQCSFDHFRDEERLMAERGVASADFGRHVADHARCLNYVARLWAARREHPRTAPESGEVQRQLAEYWRRHIAEYDLGVAWDRDAPADRGFW